MHETLMDYTEERTPTPKAGFHPDSKSVLDVPVAELQVEEVPLPTTSVIGTPEFLEKLQKELKDGKLWRSSSALADKLEVDTVALNVWLRAQVGVVSKPSKKEGVFLYALAARIETLSDENKGRPLVNEEDRYALASLASLHKMLTTIIRKYSIPISDRSAEAFNEVVAAKGKLESGIMLLGAAHKADAEKLL